MTGSPEKLGLCLRSITGTRDSRGHRNKDTGRHFSLIHCREHSPADREPGPAPHQVKVKRHAKARLPQFLPPSLSSAAFNRKRQGIENSKNDTPRRKSMRQNQS